MMLNPELRRQLWLELTPQRLIATPLIIGLILLAAYLTRGTTITQTPNIDDAVKWIAFAFGIVYGPRLSAQSLLEEISARTWDSQRSSTLTAWQLTFGKLAGGTVFAWYGIVCAATGWIVAGLLGAAQFGESANWWPGILLTAILAQATGLWCALLTSRGQARGAVHGFLCHMTGTVAGAVAFFVNSHFADNVVFGLHSELVQNGWWGLPWDSRLAMAFLLMFTAWAITAAWRLMAVALQMPSAGWIWPAFLIWLVVWTLGLGQQGPLNWGRPYVAVLAAAYLSAFADPKSETDLRRWLTALRQRNWSRALEYCPAWMVAVMMVAAVSLLLAAQDHLTLWRETPVLHVVLLSAFLLLLRDIALMHLVAFGGMVGRGSAGTLIYLAVLYGLLPFLLSLAGLGQARIALIAFPPAGVAPWLSPVCIGMEVLLLAALAGRRLRRSLAARA